MTVASLTKPLTTMITKLERQYFDPASASCDILHRMSKMTANIYRKAGSDSLRQVDEYISQQVDRFWTWIHRRIVTVKEACEIFGRSRSTIYRWIKNGRLAAVKQKGKWKIALQF